MIIQEEHIEKAINYLENLKDYNGEVQGYIDAYPILLQYVFSENFAVLNEEEKQYYESCVWILMRAVILAKGTLEDPTPDDMAKREEKHWKTIQETASSNFRDKVSPFFDLYDEEEALAFIEDSLVDDDDMSLPKEIKELIFVGLTTIVTSII